ncbi:MAG: hypothetical protein MUE97_06735, partial [Phycisphaerales bacterium]|nr:hypothetical protein [Phycisphaerales bacterium]
RDYLTNSARQTTDSVDVVDSALRRIDRQLHGGTFTPQDEEHLYRVARKATITAAIDRSRAASAQAALLNPDVQSARLEQHLDRVRDKAEAEALVRRLGALIDTPGATGDDDRLMFFLRLRGADMKVIAAQLGLSHEAARARWSRLCAKLRERVEEGALDTGEDESADATGSRQGARHA